MRSQYPTLCATNTRQAVLAFRGSFFLLMWTLQCSFCGACHCRILLVLVTTGNFDSWHTFNYRIASVIIDNVTITIYIYFTLLCENLEYLWNTLWNFLMVGTLNINVFCNVTLYTEVNIYWRFGRRTVISHVATWWHIPEHGSIQITLLARNI
jgi:hypothetical protein